LQAKAIKILTLWWTRLILYVDVSNCFLILFDFWVVIALMHDNIIILLD